MELPKASYSLRGQASEVIANCFVSSILRVAVRELERTSGATPDRNGRRENDFFAGLVEILERLNVQR
jgi:hypothetical protein